MCYGSYLILQNGKVHIPAGILALKRAQRGDDVAAIAAKDAQAAANAATEANAKAADSRDKSTQKKHPKAQICPELHGDISLKMGSSSSIARDAKGTIPTRVGHIIAENTTPTQFGQRM